MHTFIHTHAPVSRFARGVASVGDMLCVGKRENDMFSSPSHSLIPPHLVCVVKHYDFLSSVRVCTLVNVEYNMSYQRSRTPPSPHTRLGTSDGPILMLSVPAQGSDITITRQLQEHSAPISDLATNSRGQLASCDESGSIIVWQDPLSCGESSVIIGDARLVLLSAYSLS